MRDNPSYEGDYPTVNEIPEEVWDRLLITREDFSAHRARRLAREESLPVLGDSAPDFTAERLDANGERTGELLKHSSMRGMPVGLVFGNYT
jgi:hypothetical protein